MIRNYCFLLFCITSFYLVAGDGVSSTTNSLDKSDNLSKDLKLRELADVTVNVPKAVTIASGSDIIYDFNANKKIIGLGEKSLISVTYQVNDANKASLSFGKFGNIQPGFEMKSVYFDFKLEDTRTDKTNPPVFTVCGMLGDADSGIINDVQFRFHFSFTVACSQGNNGIIANSIKAKTSMTSVLFTFTDETNPITVSYTAEKGAGMKNSLIVGKIDDGDIKGLAVVGDKLVLNSPGDSKTYYFGCISGEQTKGTAVNMTVDLLEFTVNDNMHVGGLFYKGSSSIEGSFFAVRNKFLLGGEGMYTSSTFAGLVNEFSGSEFAYSFVYLKIDKIIDYVEPEKSSFFGFVNKMETLTLKSCQVYLYAYGESIYFPTISKAFYAVGSTGKITDIINSFAFVDRDHAGYGIVMGEIKLDEKLLGMYYRGDGVDRRNREQAYIDGKVPNYQTGSLNGKEYIYYTQGLSLTDNGIQIPADYDSEKNNEIVYKYNADNRIPTAEILRRSSTLPEEITFDNQGNKESTIAVILLSVPTADVKIGVTCDSFLTGGGCNKYILVNANSMSNSAYVQVLYQALPYWRTCVTFNVTSTDVTYNDYQIRPVCFYAQNNDPSVTLPVTGIECTEGKRCQYNVPGKHLIVNYDVFLGEKKLYGEKSVGIHGGRLYVDFTYPTNDIDEGDKYVVTLKTVWYHLGETVEHLDDVTIINVNKAGFTAEYVRKYQIGEDNVVGTLRIKLDTTPMKTVNLLLSCGSLICEPSNIDFINIDQVTVSVKRDYLTSYNYNNDKGETTFSITGTVSSEDSQYNAITFKPVEAVVKNDLKAEIKSSLQKIDLTCSGNSLYAVSVMVGRIPQKDVHISITPKNKNLVVKPNAFTLNKDNNLKTIYISNAAVCRENITEVLTFEVNSEDDLYSSNELSKQTISVTSVVYEHELDRSAAPKIDKLKLKDDSEELIEVIFDKNIYIDGMDSEKKIDCNAIIKESDVSLYGLSECTVVNENELEMKFSKAVTAGSSSISFKGDVIRSSQNSINAFSEETKTIEDRTPTPLLSKCLFSDNGDKITVRFDREIFGVTTSQVACSTVFTNNNLGDNCQLRKSGTQQIIIILGSGAKIIPNDKLTLSNNNPIVSSEGHIHHATGEISVDYPQNPPSVKAVINGGDVINECGSLKLDGLFSEGGYGRPFKYVWKSSTDLIKNEIDVANTANDGYLTINGSANIPATFTITLEVTSFLNPTAGTEVVTITKDTSQRYIEVSIDGVNDLSYKKDQTIDITGRGVLKTCGSESITNGLIYQWSGKNTDNSEVVSIDNFLTGDVKTISIEPGELDIGNYEFTLKVSDGNGLSGSESVTIHIVPRDLIVVLNGASNRNVPVANPVVLDISSSYDPDEYEKNFIYTWECEMNNHEKCVKADDSSLTLDSSSIVTIPGDTLKVKNVYKFTGRMTGVTTKRSGSTMVSVNVLEENIEMTVEIIVLNPKTENIYPHDYMLELYGNVIGDYSPLSFEWVYSNDKSLNIFKPSLSGVNGKEITVDCSKLLSGKHRVMFKVMYKDYEFVSEFEFTVYMPPYGGYIIANKDTVEFGDKVSISASGWVSLTSMKYRFAAKVGDKISYLNDYSVSNAYEGILPIGLASDGYKLTIIVYAMDEYNGVGETDHDKKNVKVEIKSLQPSNSQIIEQTIDNLVKSNNHDQVYVVIDGITSSLERHCTGNDECYNGGSCSSNKCKCVNGFSGDNCEIPNPIDCELSDEYDYGPYNKGCGLAEREKWHKIKTQAKYGGKECEIIKEKETKVLGTCVEDVDGGWDNWSDYSECDAKCEIYNSRDIIGKQYRTRNCTSPLPSGNGKDCEGEKIEYRNCVVSCPAPLKPCPGQYIDSDGNLQTTGCSGLTRGSCTRTKTNCKAYEPGCSAYCVCQEGYTGEKCEYTTDEVEDEKKINTVLINSYKQSLNSIHNSADIHSTLSSNLKKLSKSILEDNAKESLLNLISESVTKVGKSKSKNLPLDALKQYVEATSTLLENEGKEKIINKKSRILEEGNGKNIVKIIENIGEIYNNNTSGESLNVNTDGISITCQSLDSNNNNNRFPRSGVEPASDSSVTAKETSIGSTDLTLTNSHGCKSVELVEWNTVPTSNTDEKLVSGMITINLHDDNGKKEIKNAQEPIFFRQKINKPESMKDVQCSYVNEETGELITDGVYVYYIEKMEDGSVFVTCGATHLSSFSIKTDNIMPKMNIVNPISDAKLLLNYSMENALVPIILGSVLLICVISWCYTKYKDSEELSIVTQEKANKFLSVGLLDEVKKIKDDKMTIVKNFALRMKSDHSWLAPALREADEIIVINRSQRILCLTCQVLTSTAINALFFGMNAENVAQLISTSIISTLCMLPCTVLVPWLYKYANGCTSKTISNKRKWWRLKSLKNRFKSYFTSGITSPELRRLKIGLLSTSSIYVIFAFIFYIVSLLVMPFGVPSLLITACLIVLILETVFSLIATNLTERVPFIFLFVVDLFMFIVDVIFLVLCASISNGSTGMGYNMWKAMYNNVAMKEFDIYVENNLNCCGFKDIDDYNIQDCLNPDLLASGFVARSCEIPLVDTLKKYGAFWGIFFVVSMLFMLVKCFINLNYVFVNYNKVIANNLGDFNSEITQKAGQKIVTLLRRTVLKNKVRRKKEYVEWLRQRRMRSIITVCVNATVFIYILVMIYINLLYGVKFAPNQANSWIISSSISMAIDVFIQQPSLILLNSVAASTMGAVLNFAT